MKCLTELLRKASITRFVGRPNVSDKKTKKHTSCHSQFLTEEIENQLFLLAQSSKGTTYLWEWFTELPRVLCLLIEKSFDMCLATSQLSNKFNQIGLLSSNLNALGLLLTLFVCNLADGYSVI